VSDPRPGFLAGFAPSFARAARSALPGRKALILFFVLGVPPLLMWLASGEPPRDQREGLFFTIFFLYLQFLAPLCALLFGTEIILAEESAGTLPFLFTRPAPRASIVTGKFVAYVVVGAIALAGSLAATFAMYAGAPLPDGLTGRVYLAVVFAYPAYLGAFAVLSSFTKWSLLAGFLYAFGVEFFMAIIPGNVREATLLFYSRSLLGQWKETPRDLRVFFGTDGPASTGAALTTLLVVAAAGLVLSVWIVRRREFVERNPGRA
jgi:ABC-type transport system involved in multi-copper enzyme maturation permease subunit